MSLKDTISEDIKQAMKSRDQGALRALRAIKAAILLAETAEGANGELSSDEELKLLVRQAKQRKDAIEQFEANGRGDLAAGEKEELEVIERYLPKALTEEELKTELQQIITETGATGPADLGKVMGLATRKLAGRADGKLVSQLVKAMLAGA